MKSMYFEFRTEEEMKKIAAFLEGRGYELPNAPDAVSFQDVKNFYSRNRVYLISAEYNVYRKKYEYSFTTRQIEKSYGRTKLNITTIEALAASN